MVGGGHMVGGRVDRGAHGRFQMYAYFVFNFTKNKLLERAGGFILD